MSLPTPEREPTWYEAGWRWLETYVATARNVKGQRLAACRFTRYVAGSLLHISLRRLSGDHIRKFRLELEHDHHLSPYTVMHVLSDLRCFLRWAVDAGILERTPFPARVMPRIAETLARGLSEPEVAHLVRFPGRAGFVLRLLLETGLRWAESCQVTRHDVRGSLLEIAHTKSGRVRRVPLSPGLIEEIGEIDGPLNPFSPRSPGSFSRRVRRVSDITGFHVHRCRHTFAIRWLEAGGNLAVLQQILGHRDLSTTMRYARVTDDLVRREAERVAKVRKASRRMDDPR
ncbi:MAG: tyrosine-type recombinase/integrase [Candidatus Eisenbacteria bacterium]|uniref:Tyrosine-type recombinase/integrase n=1 Tax=Eiseniibacteriota bacterium TaxID=2212470 RepID=A0A849SUV2_UNCEI|nr:tyrosine-type recombinase/integrase [Candidatus Eisenbacteria bacterium]